MATGAPWAEGPYRVVVEFCRSGQGASRTIALKHQPNVLPNQLMGRISPQDWAGFMTDVQVLANEHPYVVKPSAGRVGSWAAGACIGACIGFCCINPDGGDWNVWIPQTEQVLAKWRPTFGQAGCTLSLQRAQMSYWIQCDVNPAHAAPGMPVAAGPGKADMPPGAYSQQGGQPAYPQQGGQPPYGAAPQPDKMGCEAAPPAAQQPYGAAPSSQQPAYGAAPAPQAAYPPTTQPAGYPPAGQPAAATYPPPV